MANVQISQLPTAEPLTGNELVPVVQNGQTVKTTTGAITSTPNQTQTFLTLNQEGTLPNSRYLSTGAGLSLSDGGPLSYYRVTLSDAAASLVSASTGMLAKTDASTVTPRTLQTSGAGLSVTDGSGVAGNPTFQLTGVAAAVANLGGTGLMAIQSGTTVGGVQILGTASQIDVANGNGTGNPTISIADNPQLPGVEAVGIPSGTTAERPVGSPGQIRFNTDTNDFEGYNGTDWASIGSGGGAAGVTSFSAGSTGLTPAGAATGAVTLSGILEVGHGGTGASSLTGYVKGSGTSAFTASATVPTSDLTGTIPNTQITGLGTMSTQNANAVAITGGSVTSLGDLSLRNDGTGAYDVTLSQNGTMTANRLLAVDVNDGDREVDLLGNLVVGSGGASVTGTNTGDQNIFQNVAVSGQSTLTAAATNGTLTLVQGANVTLTTDALTNSVTIAATGGGGGGSGTVTSVNASGGTTGMTFSGGPVTTSGTLTLAGTLAVANGGTGSTTAAGALTNLGAYPASNPSGFTSNTGTVTSVALTAPSIFTVTGSPVTTSGTLAIAYSGTALPIANGGTGATSAAAALTSLGAYPASNPNGYTSNTGTVTSVDASGGTTGLTFTGGPVTTSGTVTLSGTLAVANGGSGATTQAGARTNFGATTVGSNLFTLTNPSAITFLRVNADNTVSALDAATFRSAIGAGTGSGTVTSVGGTGTVNGITLTGTVTSSGDLTLGGTLSGVSLTTQVTGTLPIANGGTNATATPTNGGVSYGTGSAYAFTAAGTAGQVLTSNGAAAPTWGGISGGTF